MENIDVGMTPYFRGLERRLDCPAVRRRALLEDVRREARQFTQEKPDATPEEVAAYLGDPQELAQGLLETLNQEELSRYRRRRKLLLRGVVALLAVALLGASIWGYYQYTHPPEAVFVETSTTLTIYGEGDKP